MLLWSFKPICALVCSSPVNSGEDAAESDVEELDEELDSELKELGLDASDDTSNLSYFVLPSCVLKLTLKLEPRGIVGISVVILHSNEESIGCSQFRYGPIQIIS